jgi:RNA polymerase sigma-70 factor (ECF subfamily)
MMSFLPWRSPTRQRRHGAAEGAAGSAAAGDAGVVQARVLAALRAGDTSAIAALYEAEAPRVYRYALALAGNAAWAADATQDAFVALALRPQGFDAARGPLGAWLAGVARHALAAQWRQALGHEPLLDDAGAAVDDASAAAQAPSPEELLVQAQDEAAVWEALRRLPPVFREAVLLVDLQERSYAEAAAIAGVELNTLRTRVFRGRQRLAALLGGAGGPER